MKYLLDTDHLSILQRQSGTEYAVLRAHLARYLLTDVALSIISFHEQVLGCHAYLNHARQAREVMRGYDMLARVLRDFSQAPVIPFDSNAPTLFERLRPQALRVKTIGLRIAACALSRGLTLVSRNARDFSQVPGLPLEDWTI